MLYQLVVAGFLERDGDRFDDLGPQEIKNITGPIEKCVEST